MPTYDDFEKAPHASLMGSLKGHEAEGTAMAWSPDGERLASTSVDGVLNIWTKSTPLPARASGCPGGCATAS